MNLNRRNFLFGSAAATALAGCSTAKVGPRKPAPGEQANAAPTGFAIPPRLSVRVPSFFVAHPVSVAAAALPMRNFLLLRLSIRFTFHS